MDERDRERAPGKDEPENKQRQQRPEGLHAREDLTDHDKTPGTGSLPGRGSEGTDVGPD